MRTDLLYDERFSVSTRITLFGLMHNEFKYNQSSYVVDYRARLENRKPKLSKAKKEVEAIDGLLTFAPRGNKHIEVHFFIPL
jgi:hypothetical protein